jgi:hypothetical protein
MRLLPLSFLLVSCTPVGPVCATYSAASVTVEVVDADGTPVEGASVTFSVNDAEAQPCEDMGGSFVCGWEQAGEVTVVASAPGYVDGTGTVTVGEDNEGCHVESQTLTVVLDGQECTEEVRPSVLVTMVDGAGAPLDDGEVSWADAAIDGGSWTACDRWGDGWACGQELPGLFDIRGTVADCGQAWGQVQVGMTADACHVETEAIELEVLCGAE